MSYQKVIALDPNRRVEFHYTESEGFPGNCGICLLYAWRFSGTFLPNHEFTKKDLQKIQTGIEEACERSDASMAMMTYVSLYEDWTEEEMQHNKTYQVAKALFPHHSPSVVNNNSQNEITVATKDMN